MIAVVAATTDVDATAVVAAVFLAATCTDVRELVPLLV